MLNIQACRDDIREAMWRRQMYRDQARKKLARGDPMGDAQEVFTPAAELRNARVWKAHAQLHIHHLRLNLHAI